MEAGRAGAGHFAGDHRGAKIGPGETNVAEQMVVEAEQFAVGAAPGGPAKQAGDDVHDVSLCVQVLTFGEGGGLAPAGKGALLWRRD